MAATATTTGALSARQRIVSPEKTMMFNRQEKQELHKRLSFRDWQVGERTATAGRQADLIPGA